MQAVNSDNRHGQWSIGDDDVSNINSDTGNTSCKTAAEAWLVCRQLSKPADDWQWCWWQWMMMMMMMMMMSRAVRQSRNHDHMIFGHCRDVDYRQTDYAQNLCIKLIQYRFSDTDGWQTVHFVQPLLSFLKAVRLFDPQQAKTLTFSSLCANILAVNWIDLQKATVSYK